MMNQQPSDSVMYYSESSLLSDTLHTVALKLSKECPHWAHPTHLGAKSEALRTEAPAEEAPLSILSIILSLNECSRPGY